MKRHVKYFYRLSSTFKSFILISGFATFRLFKELDVDIRMRSQNVERFKQIAQQILEKLNLEKFRINSPSDQFMRDWKKMMILMISKTRLSVRSDCSNWLLDIVWLSIMIKERSLTERRTCVTRWILLFLCYFYCSYTELVFHSEVSYIFQLS